MKNTAINKSVITIWVLLLGKQGSVGQEVILPV